MGTTRSLSYNGLFTKAIDKPVNLTSKARKLDLPVDIYIQCELFDRLVMPILLYNGSETWGCQKLNQIERFYRKFLKDLLTLNRSTANCMVYQEVGRQGVRHL